MIVNKPFKLKLRLTIINKSVEILMIKKLLFLFVFVCAAASAQQSTNPQQALNQVNGTFFIPNQGQ